MSDSAIDLGTVILAEFRPYDPVAEAESPVYLATADVILLPDDAEAPNREYLGLVSPDVALRREMYADGQIGGASQPQLGAIKVMVDDDTAGDLYAWRTWGWDKRACEIAAYTPGAPYASRTVIWTGETTGQNVFGVGEITIGLADLQARLERPFQASTYAGTGGFEGGEDLAGQRKPEILGEVWGVAPVAVDPQNLWFDLDPVNGLTSIAAVMVGGNALVADAANPPAAGKYHADLAAGRIRLGMAPDAPLTVHCVGAIAGGATTAPTLARAVMHRCGATATDDAAMAAAAADSPMPTGWLAQDDESGREIVDRLVADIGGGFWTTTRGGFLTVGRLLPTTATSEDDAQVVAVLTDADLVKGSLTIEPVPAPPSAVELGWRRNWTPHGVEDLRGADAAAHAFALAEYRREVVAAPAALLAVHPSSEAYRPETGLSQQVDAAVVASRVAALVCSQRWWANGEWTMAPLTLEVGDEVWLRSELHQVDAPFRVIAVDENAAARKARLRLWR